MRLEDLFEQPALAQSGVLGTGLDPAQFQQRTGLSPAQAQRTVNRVVRLNPQFRTPQFRSALTNFLIDNPKTFQAANQNLRIPANQNVRPTAPQGTRALRWLAKGALRQALGAIGLIFTPTTMGDGTLDPDQAEAWSTADAFMRHMSENNPAAFVELIDAEAAAMDAQELESGYDPRDNRYYRNAQAAISAQAAADEYAGGDTAGEFNVSPGPQAQTTTPTQPALPSGDVDLGMDADAQTGTWTPPVVQAPQLTAPDLEVEIPDTKDVELPTPPAAMTQTPAQAELPNGDVDLGMDADAQTGTWTPPTTSAPAQAAQTDTETPPEIDTETPPQELPAPSVQTDTPPLEVPQTAPAEVPVRTPQTDPTPRPATAPRVAPPDVDTPPEVPTPSPVVTPRVPGQPSVPDETPSAPEVPGPETTPQRTPEPQKQPTVPEPGTAPSTSTTTAPAPAPRVLPTPRPATATSPSGTRGRGRGRGRMRLPDLPKTKEPDFDYVSWDPMATPDPLKLKQYRAKKIYPGG